MQLILVPWVEKKSRKNGLTWFPSRVKLIRPNCSQLRLIVNLLSNWDWGNPAVPWLSARTVLLSKQDVDGPTVSIMDMLDIGVAVSYQESIASFRDCVGMELFENFLLHLKQRGLVTCTHLQVECSANMRGHP